MEHKRGDIVKVKGRSGHHKVGAVGEKVQIKTLFGTDVGFYNHADVTHVRRPPAVKPIKGTGGWA